MKISTSELRKFKTNAGFIKKNGIIPILSYLKFDNGFITKTNLMSFIQMKANFKDSMLVPETNLFNFLGRSKEEFIDVYVKDGMCVISDGVQPVVKIPTEDINIFPSIPTPDEDTYELPNDVLCAINIASDFIDTNDAPDARCHVFIGGGCVAGIGFIIGYKEDISDDIPKIVLSKEVAGVVGKFPTATYKSNERYDFFDVHDSKYGFIKSTYPFFEGLKRVGDIKQEWDSFSVNKNHIIDFSDTCVAQTPAKGIVASISMKKDKIVMDMQDKDYNATVNHSAEAKGNFTQEFNFNPAFMSTLLKDIPDNDLSFHFNGSTMFIKGESGGVALIQQIVRN